ncbi:Hypothetical protein NTJ_11353 [Nesidiocoris tenuis]|uniref:Uncharacterized protein n=1 Tax=Nesidiocoris tenuis TaxID=355587 RepID=A0ABN7B2S7_9HEMI|nr:Hypothetical protein NTJ_11353 [Nesidiocoris tenuis]
MARLVPPITITSGEKWRKRCRAAFGSEFSEAAGKCALNTRHVNYDMKDIPPRLYSFYTYSISVSLTGNPDAPSFSNSSYYTGGAISFFRAEEHTSFNFLGAPRPQPHINDCHRRHLFRELMAAKFPVQRLQTIGMRVVEFENEADNFGKKRESGANY